MRDDKALPRAKRPEDAGVSSAQIAAFLRDIEENGMNVHSFMVVRHGKVAAACWRAPFTADTPHAMYSVSKTFTSAALGIAVGEGLLSLDDRVKDFFPEFTAEKKDKKLDAMTVRHLVCMQSGKNPGVFADKTKPSWVEDFFNAPWAEAPGTKYRYISENTYMISAILRRITGITLREYLTPRLFEPLGIDFPFWETDADGVEAGGWGLYARTEDLAKLMLCFLQDGVYGGRQIIPAEYVRAARSFQSDNGYNEAPDGSAGYGYGLWLNRCAPGYRADGMFSQFGIVMPEYDAVIAFTAGIPMEQEALDLIWRHFPAAFLRTDAPPVPTIGETLSIAVLENAAPFSWSTMQDAVNDRNIRFRRQVFLELIGFPVSMLPLAVTFMLPDKCGKLNDFRFVFEENAVRVSWTEGKDKNTVRAGMNGHYCYGKMRLGGIDYKVCCTAQWEKNDRLTVEIRPIETIGKRILRFTFLSGDRVRMKPSGTPPVAEIAQYIKQCFNDTCHVRPVQVVAGKLIGLLPRIVEPTHRGKFTE